MPLNSSKHYQVFITCILTDVRCKHGRCHRRGEPAAHPDHRSLYPCVPSGVERLAGLECRNIWLPSRKKHERVFEPD